MTFVTFARFFSRARDSWSEIAFDRRNKDVSIYVVDSFKCVGVLALIKIVQLENECE